MRSEVTVSRLLPVFSRATKSKMNTAPPTIQTQGCVYHTVLPELVCTDVVVELEEEPELFSPDGSCAHKAADRPQANRRKQTRSKTECRVFILFD